jgi:hypothetical protein
MCYERTLWLELPLQMLKEIDETIDELYNGELVSVYDDRLPRNLVSVIHKGKIIPAPKGV